MSEPNLTDTVELAPPQDSLRKHYLPGPAPVTVEFAALTHPGKVRPNNEDHYLVVRRRRSRAVLLTNLPEGYLPATEQDAYAMVVADGLGGAEFGELASMLALRIGWDLGLDEIKWALKVDNREARDFLDKIHVALRMIDQTLQERGRLDPDLRGMATTFTAAYTTGTDAFIAHVGDSRVYLWRAGQIWRMTRDQTLAQQLLDAGLPVQTEHLRHVLTSCLGSGASEPTVEAYHFVLLEGDRLLLCTDGLTDMVGDVEIGRIIGAHAEPQQACRALVDLALDCGGRDNVTVVLAKYALPGPAGKQG